MEPKRRWYQYSLRTLLVFVTLFALACSWLAVKLQQAKRQREAVEAIRMLGGRVAYDYELDAYGDIIPGEPPGPAWLRQILGDDLFCTVVFAKPTNDASMLILNDLSGIRRLELRRSQVTDAGLECLKSLPKLQMLDLRGGKVTDAGLEHLMGLVQLR